MCIECHLDDEGHDEPAQPATPPQKALDDPAVLHGPVQFENEADTVNGYLARPTAAGRATPIIVMHGNAAMPEDMRDAAAQLAMAGFVGLLIDPTSRWPNLSGVTREFLTSYRYLKLLLSDMRAALAFLRQQDFVAPGPVGLLGFCGGGNVSLMFAAEEPDVRAVVALYAAPYFPPERSSPTDPRPHTISFFSQITAPVQAHFGTEDVVIPLAEVRDFENELRRYQPTAEIYLYEGAQHGYYHYTDPDSYDPQATNLTRERMLSFFKQHLPGG